MRQSGILMHISSLPGPDGIGSLGKEAFAFADCFTGADAGFAALAEDFLFELMKGSPVESLRGRIAAPGLLFELC